MVAYVWCLHSSVLVAAYPCVFLLPTRTKYYSCFLVCWIPRDRYFMVHFRHLYRLFSVPSGTDDMCVRGYCAAPLGTNAGRRCPANGQQRQQCTKSATDQNVYQHNGSIFLLLVALLYGRSYKSFDRGYHKQRTGHGTKITGVLQLRSQSHNLRCASQESLGSDVDYWAEMPPIRKGAYAIWTTTNPSPWDPSAWRSHHCTRDRHRIIEKYKIPRK